VNCDLILMALILVSRVGRICLDGLIKKKRTTLNEMTLFEDFDFRDHYFDYLPIFIYSFRTQLKRAILTFMSRGRAISACFIISSNNNNAQYALQRATVADATISAQNDASKGGKNDSITRTLLRSGR
jgi:hypothetical protein